MPNLVDIGKWFWRRNLKNVKNLQKDRQTSGHLSYQFRWAEYIMGFVTQSTRG